MALDEELNKILKEVWRLDEKINEGKELSTEEKGFYDSHLPTIKNYYHGQYLYWEKK